MAATPRERLRENATEIAGTVVTGLWLAALFTGQDWWLAALLLGYLVVVPLVTLLFGDEDDAAEWWDDGWEDLWSWGGTESDEPTRADDSARENNRDALDTLRERYARGELTDEQFERKLERLLDTDTLENVEDGARERERSR